MEGEISFTLCEVTATDIMTMYEYCVRKDVPIKTFVKIIVKYIWQKFHTIEFLEAREKNGRSAIRLMGFNIESWIMCKYIELGSQSFRDLGISKLFEYGQLQIHKPTHEIFTVSISIIKSDSDKYDLIQYNPLLH